MDFREQRKIHTTHVLMKTFPLQAVASKENSSQKSLNETENIYLES